MTSNAPHTFLADSRGTASYDTERSICDKPFAPHPCPHISGSSSEFCVQRVLRLYVGRRSRNLKRAVWSNPLSKHSYRSRVAIIRLLRSVSKCFRCGLHRCEIVAITVIMTPFGGPRANPWFCSRSYQDLHRHRPRPRTLSCDQLKRPEISETPYHHTPTMFLPVTDAL